MQIAMDGYRFVSLRGEGMQIAMDGYRFVSLRDEGMQSKAILSLFTVMHNLPHFLFQNCSNSRNTYSNYFHEHFFVKSTNIQLNE
ncbi:MAG: hypothetical protein P8H39_05740 [Thalassotalea sp.]|nr:hypothetical protein [Thalassotalea sp.]